MRFSLMRLIARGGVVAALIFAVTALCCNLILYLRESYFLVSATRSWYPVTGFWWSLFAFSWTLMLIIPYLAYFLRANGWCAACCGGHQKYHLSSLFSSVVDEDASALDRQHPGKKRPILSKTAQLIVHIIMVMLGCGIMFTSLISFVCLVAVMEDRHGAAWAGVTMGVGICYLATVAFVFMQLKVRDRKRQLLSTSPDLIRRVLSDSEEAIGRRWESINRGPLSFSSSDLPDAAISDFGSLSKSDARHLLKHGSYPLAVEGEALRPMEETATEDEQVRDDDLEDLDENLIASQMSGHMPFALAKTSANKKCKDSLMRGGIVLGFAILAAFIIIMFIFQCLATYQLLAMAIDTHIVPPLPSPYGKYLQSAAGRHRQLYMQCEGPQSNLFIPTVLIETDIGSVSYEWVHVAHYLRISNWQVRVCTYDRGGYGNSEPGLKPRDARREALELHHILKLSGEVGPLILVANGYGSFITRLVAKLRSSSVLAMILVDAIHENQEVQYAKALGWSSAELAAVNKAEYSELFRKKMLAPVGISRMQLTLASELHGKEQDAQRAAMGQLSFYDAVWNEAIHIYGLSQQAVIADRGSGFGSIPLTLVVSEYALNGTCEQNHIPPSRCEDYLDQRDELGDLPMKLQQDLLTLSTNSRLVYAMQSSKAVHLEQPEFLANVIVETAKRAFNFTILPAPPF